MTAVTVSGGGTPPDDSMTVGEDSAHSSASLRNLSSKIVKGLGGRKKSSGQSPSTNIVHGGAESVAPEHVGASLGATNKVAGGVGFVGSMLGEVLVSYSTSTLPPGKRYSISATSAHYEELAAEAGIDLDADEINMEGVGAACILPSKAVVPVARYPRSYGTKKSDEQGI